MPDLYSIITIAIYFTVAIVVGGLLFFGLIFGAMYTRIPTKKLKKIIELGKLHRGMEVLDAGAGFGTISFEAAYSGAHITAVEIDPVKVAAMKLLLSYNNRLAKMSPISPVPVKAPSYLAVDIVRANLLKVDWSKADIVYCYLSPALMPKVAVKAQAEMKQGAKLISVEYPIGNWKPLYADVPDKIYEYEIGPRIEA
jgi:precorrin-6B methylase 2